MDAYIIVLVFCVVRTRYVVTISDIVLANVITSGEKTENPFILRKFDKYINEKP